MPADSDLNEVVARSTGKLGKNAAGVSPGQETFQTLPKISLDQEQMLKVGDQSLVYLNAREAVLPAGEVRIETMPKTTMAG